VATLRAHGIEAALPSGFEGRIFIRPSTGNHVARPVAHFATFALPAEVGDFGGGAVGLMGPRDIFAALFEYGPESLGTRLFAQTGMPGALTAAHFRPTVLRRGIPGHSGTQWFFTQSGRPFTFYAVLGDHERRVHLVPQVNALLQAIAVSPASPVVGPWN
jgi:hypothetical protein